MNDRTGPKISARYLAHRQKSKRVGVYTNQSSGQINIEGQENILRWLCAKAFENRDLQVVSLTSPLPADPVETIKSGSILGGPVVLRRRRRSPAAGECRKAHALKQKMSGAASDIARIDSIIAKIDVAGLIKRDPQGRPPSSARTARVPRTRCSAPKTNAKLVLR
jgi:hypothetical protein